MIRDIEIGSISLIQTTYDNVLPEIMIVRWTKVSGF